MTSLNKILALAALTGAALSASVAQAITYDATSMGTSSPAGATFVASGGSLGLKSQAGYKFLGVTGGAAGNEIDIGQSLTIKFGGAQVVDELIIGLLFDGPEYGDPKEEALVKINYNGSVYSLKAVGETSAVWTGLGAVSNLSPAAHGLGAIWKIVNPFGTTAVTEIKLYPNSAVKGSDFGLVGFSTHAVPDAASTLGLLGAALLGLAYFRRNVQS